MTSNSGAATPDERDVFRLPDLGEGLQDAEIVIWLVSEGDHVVVDQPMVTIDSEKAVTDVPSPRSGRILRLRGAPGDRIEVGAILVEYEAEEEEADRGGAPALVGRLPEHEPAGTTPAQRPMAAPSVRALARELGVDLSAVEATGERGEVTHADVERAAPGAAVTDAPASPGPVGPTRPIEGAEPLRGPRLAMAQAMAEAHRQVASATVMDEADVDAWPEHEDVTARLVRAIVAGCAASPALNAWYDAGAVARRLHEEVRVGVAVDTEQGLFVPVLSDARGRSAAHIRQELDELEAAVRDRSIGGERLRGGTVALSNFGMLVGRFAQLTLPPPQVAILGAGRIAERVVAHDDAISVRRLLPLSLTFDHRAVTGGEAAAFLRTVIDDLQDPS